MLAAVYFRSTTHTENGNIKKIEVINTNHTNKGILRIVIPGARIFKIVVIKLILTKI